MRRITTQPRENWPAIVESQGMHFHSPGEMKYWDESACYVFDRSQIDRLEAATYALNDLCLQAVDHVIENNLFHLFAIPPAFVPWIVHSWNNDEFTLYGRFDFAYDGKGPPKLLEFNADTPTSLLEAAVIQWHWFKNMAENPGAFSPELARLARFDQFNSIHEKLIEAWRSHLPKVKAIAAGNPHFNPTMYFAASGGSLEDFMTATYLRDTAMQGGFETQFLDMNQIGFNQRRALFVDMREMPIHNLFKLYPWEWLVREQFAPMLMQARVNWIEAPWKMILSNKAILPILSQMFPACDYLLEASFEPINGPHVRKPILSREGNNIAMVIGGKPVMETGGPYEGPYVYQRLSPLSDHQGNLPVVGSWLVNGHACGIGIREDTSPITGNTSRFVPHVFHV